MAKALKVVERKETEEARQSALTEALKTITKHYGTGAVMKLGEKSDMQVASLSTGSLSLDKALGIGGYPKGRVIEIYGAESSGKTTLALHAIVEAQKDGGTVAFIDAEHALNPKYAAQLGVQIDDLLISQPDSGEEALAIADALVQSSAVDLIVIDSVAALVPQAEIEGEMGASHVGLQARLMSQALRKLSGTVNKTKTVVIFINQLREKVGMSFGNPEVTPGGRALKFYASVRLQVNRGAKVDLAGKHCGNWMKIKVTKNKVAPPFKVVELELLFGTGISTLGELVDLSMEKDLIKKSGTWYSYGELRLGQGRENAKKYLEEHTEIVEELKELLKKSEIEK